jgi:hypothetical protein
MRKAERYLRGLELSTAVRCRAARTVVLASAMLAVMGAAQTESPQTHLRRQGDPVELFDSGLLGPDRRPFTGVVKLVPVKDGHAGTPAFIPVVSGNIECRLKPNELGSFYLALFLERDRAIGYEKWVVPDLSYRISVTTVRQAPPFSPTDLDYSSRVQAPSIQQADVAGLIADLAVRPIMGPGFSNGRVLVADSAGMIESVAGNTSDCVIVDGSSRPCLSDISGDVAKSPTTGVTVTGIQGHAVSSMAPSDGQALVYSGAASAWVPTTGSASQTSTTISGDVKGTVSNAKVTGIQGFPVSTIAPTDGQLLSYNAASGLWIPTSGAVASITGDVKGLLSSVTVTGIQGYPVSPNAVSDGQMLVYNGTSKSWTPGTLVAGSGIGLKWSKGMYIVSSTAATHVWSTLSTISFGVIPNLGCSTNGSLNLPGAFPNEPVVAGWPPALPLGVIGQMAVSAQNTVSITMCNFSGAALFIGPLTYEASVLRDFTVGSASTGQ